MKWNNKQLARVVVDLMETQKDVHAVADSLVRFLGERHELRRMGDVIRSIEQFWKERHGAATIIIETAHPIHDTLRKQLDHLAKGAEVRAIVVSEMIGGARLRIDDRVIDGTVRGALEQLRLTLYGN